MGVFLALGLLMLKDLRTIYRRKASFIIELIILIITLVITGLLCWALGKATSNNLPAKTYPLWAADDSKSYYVRMTNGFNITEEAYVINWLQHACPMYHFNGTKDQKDLLTTLWLKDFKVTGEPSEHRLYYELIGFDEVNIGLPADKVYGGIFGEPTDTYKDGMVKQEILFLQGCINRAFVEQHRGPEADPIPLLATGRMPPGSMSFMYMIVGMMFSMCILVVVLLALREIATEKENGIHAYMLAVGLPRWTFFTSHYIFATVKTNVFLFVAFIIIAAFSKPLTAFRICYTSFVYAQVIIAFTMMIASFVKRNLYVTLGTIAYVMTGNILKNTVNVTIFQQTKAVLFSFLHPGCAFGFIMEHFDASASYEKPVRIFAGYSEYMPVAPPFIFMFLQYFFFMVMTYYIDYVVPTDDTPKLHPLFFFGLGRKEADEPDTEEKGESKEKEQNSRHEEIQATGELQLEVKDLVKKWPNGDIAVNKISFKVHSGQVVALLGHNGAGKSTTFSCLTGFLKPTSGTIKLAKADHAVVITTHYMDEADALSDHINIMAHGEIICSGSSEFLKSKFGTGIMLVVDLDLSHREKMDVITKCANEILDVVKKSCPDAEFYGPVASQLNIIIDARNRPAFPQLFAELESKSPCLKIESFDVTMNSLDQVFVNVTKEAAGVKEVKPDVEIMKFIQKRRQFHLGGSLFLKQMYALLVRKFHNFRRDYLQILVATIAFLLIFVAVIEKKTRGKEYHIGVKNADHRDLALQNYFQQNIEIFTMVDTKNLKSQMNNFLEQQYQLKPSNDHPPAADKFAAYAQMVKLRWSLPTPTIFYLLDDRTSVVFTNPGFKYGHYVALQLFYEAFTPGAITGRLTYIPTNDKSNKLFDKDNGSNILLGLIFLLAYPLIFALPVFLYTTERVQGAVHLYARTHLTKITYWMTAFLSELVALFLFSAIIAIVLFSTSFYHISCLGPFLLFTFLLSFAFIAQAYAASQMFNSSGVTFTMLMIWNLVLFMILVMIIEAIKKHFYPITYLTFFMPSLAMFKLLLSIHLQCHQSISFSDLLRTSDDDFHPFVLIGGTTAIHAALLIGVLLYPRIAALFVGDNKQLASKTDTSDITKERERVSQGGIINYAVVAVGLKKVFGYPCNRKTVVHNITFGVSKNECFGLLGSNGAGKSTTFNMLTASLRPTAGKAYVGGTSVANSPEFGFCPQKESILMELTNTGASMILTSHSMEECEALCTRIAFLTGGNMIALGTSQHLKHTLGNEYVLTVCLHGPNAKLVEELDKRFKEAFEAEGVNDPTDVNLKYIFKKKGQKMSVMYARLDRIVAELESAYAPYSHTNLLQPIIRDCLIVGATLEDVFVKLANNSIDNRLL
uniref:ABC transporter domain-containing protein n=1 Tax=Panagrellus redivivus TaxID=6233 RepID=A0A7E4ZQX4_PANRE